MFETLITLTQNRTKNIHKLRSFSFQTSSFFFYVWFRTGFDQSQPITALFGLLTANFYSHYKVFLAERFISFDIISSNRTRGLDKLFSVFNVSCVFGNFLKKFLTFL